MTFASASRAGLCYVVEATPNTTPVTGNHNALRFTGGDSLKLDIKNDSSKELRPDGQIPDLYPVSASVGGGFSAEFSYKEYEPFLAAALRGSFGTAVNATISATFTTTTLTAASGTPFASLSDGQYVLISGAASPQNNGVHRILTKTSSTVLTFAAGEFVAEGPTASVVLNSSRMSNGTTDTAFTLEKRFTDIAVFHAFRGLYVNKIDLSFDTGKAAEIKFDFLGMSAPPPSGSTFLPGTTTAATAFDIFNFTGFGQLIEGGVVLGSMKNISLSLDTGRRGRDALGTLGFVGVAEGTTKVTIKGSAYFTDSALYTKYINSTASSLAFRIKDSAGNGYGFTLPKVRYDSAQSLIGGQNSDVMCELELTAVLDPVTGKTIFIDKFGA